MTLEEFWERFGDSDLLCKGCRYEDICSRGVTSTGRSILYPACVDASEPEGFLDEYKVAALEAEWEDEEEEEDEDEESY